MESSAGDTDCARSNFSGANFCDPYLIEADLVEADAVEADAVEADLRFSLAAGRERGVCADEPAIRRFTIQRSRRAPIPDSPHPFFNQRSKGTQSAWCSRTLAPW